MSSQQIANYLGGVLETFFSCSESNHLPPKIDQLLYHLQNHLVPPEYLIRYSASPNLWLGMRFDQHSIHYACQNNKLGYIQWVHTWNNLLTAKYYLPETCHNGYIELSKWIMDNYNISNNLFNQAFYNACTNNCLPLVEYITQYSHFSPDNIDQTFRRVVSNGHLAVAQLLYSLYQIDLRSWDDYPFRYACKNGHLQVAKWLKQVCPTIAHDSKDNFAFYTTCASGHLEVGKWLKKEWPEIDHRAYDEYAFRSACENGHFLVAKWLLETWPSIEFRTYRDYAFRCACGNGHLEIGQWLYNKMATIEEKVITNAFELACQNGHLPVIEWLHTFCNLSYTAKIFVDVCKHNRLNILKWLVKNLAPTTIDKYYYNITFHFACRSGNLDLAKWLVNECPEINYNVTDNETFRFACRNGHLDIAKWLQETWPKINHDEHRNLAFLWACQNGSLDVAKWLYELRPVPYTHHTPEVFISACQNGHLTTAKWLTTIYTIPRKILSEAFKYACTYNQLDVAIWLKKKVIFIQQANFNQAYQDATRNKYYHIVEWLKDNFFYICK